MVFEKKLKVITIFVPSELECVFSSSVYFQDFLFIICFQQFDYEVP